MRIFRQFIPAIMSAIVGVIAPSQITTAATISEIKDIAEEITVQILPQGPEGSGVIIGRQGNVYYILTARHVIDSTKSNEEALVLTHDDQEYEIDMTRVRHLPGKVDLSLLQFVSDRDYPVATIGDFQHTLYVNREYGEPAEYATPDSTPVAGEYPYIFVSGWPLYSNQWVFNPGILYDNSATAISNPIVAVPQDNPGQWNGYELLYTNLTHRGMSGGPVLDASGRVIGIHGRADGKEIVGDDQILQNYLDEADSTLPVKLGLSTAVPIQTFLEWAKEQPDVGGGITIDTSPPETLEQTEITSWQPPLETEDQNNPFYWVELGNQLWRLDRIEEAIANFDRAIRLDRDFYLAWFGKGFAHGFDQQFEKALAACTQAIEIKRDYYDGYRCQAGALQRLQRFDRALTALNKAMELNDRNSSDWGTKGELLFALGQPKGALAAFDKAIQLREEQQLEESALLFSNRAFILTALERYEQALSDLDRAIELDAEYAPAWSNRGAVYQRLERYEESLEAYNQAVELAPNDVNAWNNRGITLYNLGRNEEALASVEKALEIRPNYQPALDNRAALQEIMR
jgi:tetratricopeptide (TPR) repeat protein